MHGIFFHDFPGFPGFPELVGTLYSALLSAFIKLQFVIKIFVLSIFQRPLKTGFTIFKNRKSVQNFRTFTVAI